MGGSVTQLWAVLGAGGAGDNQAQGKGRGKVGFHLSVVEVRPVASQSPGSATVPLSLSPRSQLTANSN